MTRDRAWDDPALTAQCNVCAGPFGAVYDFYIERPRLARLVLGAMWGWTPGPSIAASRRSLSCPRERPCSTPVDLCLRYGGLHCVESPEAPLRDMARCLRAGGRLLGSTFLAQGSRRQCLLLGNEDFGSTGSAADLQRWLSGAGLANASIDREDGLSVFSARKL